MVLGQEQVPQAQVPGFGLELFENGRVCAESLVACAQLGFEEVVCGDAVFFDEFFDLVVC